MFVRVMEMTYKKLVSKKITQSQTPSLAFEATVDTIISKIYVHNPNNHDVRVKIYFVDKSNPNEYDSNQVNEDMTQAFDTIIPTCDTAILGNGITLTSNQCVYIKPESNVVIHIFGKTIL